MFGAFINALAVESSIFFVFIAGYLFQHLSSRFLFNSYLIQKIKTVILPYLIFSIPALIIFTLLTERTGMWPWFYDLPIWGQIGLFLLTGKHLAPLWFVPTIALFYLAAPIFLFIDRRFPSGYWVIAPLLLLASAIGRGGYLGPLNMALYLLPFYMLGMSFCHYQDAALGIVRKWWLLFAIVAAGSLIAIVLNVAPPPYWQVPLKFSLVLLLTWLLWRYHKVFGTKLNYISEVSFGIFFVHAYFISAIKVLAVYVLMGDIYKGEGAEVIVGTPLTFTIYVGTVLAASLAAIWIAKKVLGKKSRMVIGA